MTKSTDYEFQNNKTSGKRSVFFGCSRIKDYVMNFMIRDLDFTFESSFDVISGVSKKNKISYKGKKVKREDDEEDSQIMQNKMSVMASLGG